MFSKGQKVVVMNKTTGVSLEHSKVLKNAKEDNQPFLYFAGMRDERCICSERFSDVEGGNGDFFMPDDLIPYIEDAHEPSSTDDAIDKYLISELERKLKEYEDGASIIKSAIELLKTK